MNLDQFQKSLTESESALLIGIGMAIFSAVEAGAPQRTLVDRLQVHEDNFEKLGQTKASQMMTMLKMMAQSTARR
ncbi:MAG: hypothetical protein JWQ89_426 [Devosia sp.]|uniref:hypothetical protein n=1 Tax=Devosia sp. TaxID=1871048 RepID=UPI0026334B46|nr:hypothetical protein [Devosia sp.]MDB5538699.1 hypothetical protein [Devosia sp.]